MKEITRETLDAALTNIVNLRELHRRAGEIMEELSIALCYQYLWKEWGDSKRKFAFLEPFAGHILPRLYFVRITGELRDQYRKKLQLRLKYWPNPKEDQHKDDVIEKFIPATDIPDILWLKLWDEFLKRERR